MKPTVTRCTAAALVAAAGFAAVAPAYAQDNRPDAALLRFPDVSETHIVFSYANDLWVVPKDGGTAVPLASPAGQETFPRFSPDGQSVAFVGNYEGGRDLYTIDMPGGPNAGIAFRLTYHPGGERLNDWLETDDGEQHIVFASSGHQGIGRTQDIYTISPDGGQPRDLPIPYGTTGSISPSGEWLAYTPSDRDFRTWKRYRGGLASDIWLFNLNTNESRQMTTWEGTDTQPMWIPGGNGEAVYYLSDAGPNHRLNIWKYDIGDDEHEQITEFEDHDVRFPGIGPGDNGRGEIVFQAGPSLYLLNLRNERVEEVEVTIPGDRPTLRPRNINVAANITDFAVSPAGEKVVVEARGDIWTLPADKGGPARNLTRTDGVAERDPIWSPSGKWIAFLSDATGEYEIYITQSDGRGETRQLTSDGEHWRYLEAFTPDSEHLVFSDKAGAVFLMDIETGEYKEIFRDSWANSPSISLSHDSKWIATSLANDNGMNSVYLYSIEDDELHRVTSDFFSASSPAFDREGDFLYYVSTMSFSPTYSDIDSTFIYQNSDMIIAVPLHDEVENPWLPEVDAVAWEEEEEDEETEDATEDNGEADSGDADEDETAEDIHPLHGVWSGEASGLAAMGMPQDTVSYTMVITVDEDGEILGYSEQMGETEPLGDVVRYDEATREFYSESTDEFPGAGSLTTVSRGTVGNGTMEGTWEITGFMSGSGSWSAERSDTELSDEQMETIDEVNGTSADSDEPIRIDLDGFEERGMVIPVGNGSYGSLQVNDKNQLIFMSMAGGIPSIKLFNPDSPEDGARNVITGIGGFGLTPDGKKLIVVQSNTRFGVVNASPGQSLSDPVDVSNMRTDIDPRDEWRQILTDAWRIQRDFFYDPGLHGVDWDGVYKRYIAMVDHITTREDLSNLIGEMISEFNVGHAYYWGGDVEGQPFRNTGMLGADYELVTMTDGMGNDHSAYRIAHIYHGAPWDADARGPLSTPGVDVEVGDFILAVNGVPVDTSKDIYAAFLDTAGDVVELTVSDMPWVVEEDEDAEEANANGEDETESAPSTRYVFVEAMGSEAGLRYRAWIEANRRYVDEQTDGKVGYIYVPNTGINGQNDLFRQFYGQVHKQALIIDERWNGGGQIPTRFIELLNRPRVSYWARRDGKDWPWPYDSHQGPKAMLINGAAGSGGDMFPWLFRHNELGALIGMRTWGGLVGISGNPSLIDGGYTAVPTFGFYETDGTWGVEGHGVDPDIMVVDDPGLMVSEGPDDIADPQLDAAIEHLLEQIETNAYQPPQRPAGPDRSGMGITEEDR